MYYQRAAMGDTAALAQIIEESIRREITGGPWTREWEIEDQMDTGGNPGAHTYAGNMAEVCQERPNIVSYLDQLIKGINEKNVSGWTNGPAGDQGKGILYGVGAIALLGLLFPSFGQKVQTVFTRTALEGMDLINKARSIMARTKEDIEDLLAEASLGGITKKPRP